jgi:hypothetical protein
MISGLDSGASVPLRPLADGRFLIMAGRNAAEVLEILQRRADGLAETVSAAGVIWHRI